MVRFGGRTAEEAVAAVAGANRQVAAVAMGLPDASVRTVPDDRTAAGRRVGR